MTESGGGVGEGSTSGEERGRVRGFAGETEARPETDAAAVSPQGRLRQSTAVRGQREFAV